ncbi:MAG: pilus assembly protein TadG-related protein [Anaerolineae bacterium]|nr:pilus assembly protein TadG-related protein [Anaerolineae bacterium]MDH7473539.1 pilus assembly protein TadG-related protein [Anaerolineae bacterium]
MRMNDHQKRPAPILPQVLQPAGGSEAGQSIIILTVAMIVFIALLGLALDLGLVYVRRIQLSRAVDAAALAAVVELPDVDAAEATATRFFHANGFPNADPDVVPGTGVMQSNWLTVTARIQQPLFFMPLFNIRSVPIAALAVAEYKSPVEIYTSQTGESGVEGVVNLSVFGPEQWTGYGDAFIPLYSDFSHTPNANWDELEGKYTFRILVPPDYSDPYVQVEILDPDCYNKPNPGDNMVEVEYVQTGEKHLRTISPPCSDRRDGCLVPTQDPCVNPTTGESCNPYWFVRMDENRIYSSANGGRPSSYTASSNTTTRYTLYYLSEGDNVKHVIHSYTKGGADSDANTDLQWVTPEGFRFRLSDYPDVAVAENGSRSFFLEVKPTAGASENGFDLWAGPSASLLPIKDVNERNVYLLREGLEHHSSGGIVITGIGYLPLNVNTSTAFTITFGYLPPEAAGVYMRVHNFDNDYPSLGQSLHFYLEGVPDFHVVGALSGGNEWRMNRFQIPENFFGGYLRARYDTTQYDTSSWRLEYEGVVGSTFVRLIK